MFNLKYVLNKKYVQFKTENDYHIRSYESDK
jgi:hypothetical protein